LRVTLIGSGNVATILGKKIHNSGHIIHQVYSRNTQHATILANELNAEIAQEPSDIDASADIFIIAISDDSLHKIHEWFRTKDKLVVHTAGSVSINVLEKVSDNYGILYPLQTIRKELGKEPLLPVLVDGNTEWNKTKLLAFAQSFADTTGYANDEERSKLHLAAVFTNNFSNFLFTLAEDYCKKEGIEFRMIIPLLQETVNRLEYSSPADVQTGPAARNDQQTIDKHLKMLQEYPIMESMYRVMSDAIIAYKLKVKT
jgi:predicted short-subunit dehydrogenase-like oxidoreductase (DUF2520 family)